MVEVAKRAQVQYNQPKGSHRVYLLLISKLALLHENTLSIFNTRGDHWPSLDAFTSVAVKFSLCSPHLVPSFAKQQTERTRNGGN